MKKSFTLLFCSLLCIAVAHGEVTHSLSGTVLTISGTGAMQNYTSASQTPWKSSLTSITELIVEEGVTHIGAYAFDGAKKLAKVTFPSTLQSMGDNAFSYCDAMSEIHAYSPNQWASVTIGDSYPLHTHPFADSDASTRKFFFYGSTSATSTLTFVAGLKEIKTYTFYRATDIKEVSIPGTVEKIGNYALACNITNNLAINRKTPPTTGTKAITFKSGNTFLYVPEGAGDGYKNKPWKSSDVDGANYIGYYSNYEWKDHSSLVVSGLGGRLSRTSGTKIGTANISWNLSEDGVLTLEGNGSIPSLTSSNTTSDASKVLLPWYRFRRLVHKVVVKGNISALANSLAFSYGLAEVEVEQQNIPTASSIAYSSLFNQIDDVILSIKPSSLTDANIAALGVTPWNNARLSVALSEPVSFSEEANAEDLEVLDLVSTYIEEPFTLELNRTLSNEYANTFCSPVDMDADLIAATFGAGTKVYTLTTSLFNPTANTLQLDFAEQSSIEAGKPYVIQPANTTTNPTIVGVDPASAVSAAGSVATSDVTFYGTLTPRDVTENEIANGSFIFLQANNTLAWAEAGTLKGMRAYFIFDNNVAENVKNIRPIMHLGQTATAITTVDVAPQAGDAQKIIRNGQLLIIRDGKTYNAMGMTIE